MRKGKLRVLNRVLQRFHKQKRLRVGEYRMLYNVSYVSHDHGQDLEIK